MHAAAVARDGDSVRGALHALQASNIAPVGMAQAAIGPGMGVYSRYAKVLEVGGEPMSVRGALHCINEALDAYLTEQDGELDADSRFCDAPDRVRALAYRLHTLATEGLGTGGPCLQRPCGGVAGNSEQGNGIENDAPGSGDVGIIFKKGLYTMYKITYLPKKYKDITFGEKETTTEILFHGAFHNLSGIPYIQKGCGLRYGKKKDKFFLAVDHCSMLSKIVASKFEKHPDYRIECTVKKDERETDGYICAAEEPNTEWNLGIVVICIKYEI